jgi:hypothetical protein
VLARCRLLLLSDIDLLSNVVTRDMPSSQKTMLANFQQVQEQINLFAISFNRRHMWEYTCANAIANHVLRDYQVVVDPRTGRRARPSRDLSNRVLQFFTNTYNLTDDHSPARLLTIAREMLVLGADQGEAVCRSRLKWNLESTGVVPIAPQILPRRPEAVRQEPEAPPEPPRQAVAHTVA